MKLRIGGNSLRLRLARGEVARLAESGRVEESLRFAGGRQMVYVLEASADAAAMLARYDERGITIQVPLALVTEWAATDRVEMEADQPLGDGTALHLLVEKDFPCGHRAGDSEDTFAELADAHRR